MINKKIKAVCFSLILILYSVNGSGCMISAHYVKFWGLAYLAIQSFNYGNPSQPLWTLYDAFIPFQQALQLPIFFLLYGVLTPQVTITNPSSETSISTGSLSGILTSVAANQITTFQPQPLTFDVLNSFYLIGTGGAAGTTTDLPTIAE